MLCDAVLFKAKFVWQLPWSQLTAVVNIPNLRKSRDTQESMRLQEDAVVVQALSRVPFFATPWAAAREASLSSTIFWSLLKSWPRQIFTLGTSTKEAIITGETNNSS